MSRQSGIHIDGAAKTVSSLRSRTVTKPVAKQSPDFLVARLGMTAPEILAHQIEAGLEQFERRAERVGDGGSGGWHADHPR